MEAQPFGTNIGPFSLTTEKQIRPISGLAPIVGVTDQSDPVMGLFSTLGPVFASRVDLRPIFEFAPWEIDRQGGTQLLVPPRRRRAEARKALCI